MVATKTAESITIAGIPSLNNEKTISFVAEQIGKVMEDRPEDSAFEIVDCDGGSRDGTVRSFLAAKTAIKKTVLRISPEKGGKGSAFREFFRYVKKRGAVRAIVNDSDLKSIGEEWVNLQLDAIGKHGYDYATPLYSRYKYDGTITKNICYPLVYGLFCRNIRQPIGGDFAFSGRLAEHWLKQKWPPNAQKFGIDIFMTTNAILGGFRICQVNLGAKVHDVKDPAKTLAPMFFQVVSTLFEVINANRKKLEGLKKVREVRVLGPERLPEPQQFEVNSGLMKKRFLAGFRRDEALLRKCLSKESFGLLRSCAEKREVRIDAAGWSRIVYDYIEYYGKHRAHARKIVGSMIPVWFGRVHSFVNETEGMRTDKAEKIVKKQAKEFFRQRYYLLDRL
jgi:glycosyltransferase involved in cell wall biosynthesis